jgi:hypothetical protein
MLRPLPVLATFAALLTAACASSPQPETQRLTSDIVSNASQFNACASNEIPSCRTTSTRITNRYAPMTCGCLLRDELVQPPPLH